MHGSEDEVRRRLRSALDELARVSECERVVANDDLDTAVAESACIDRLRRELAEALRVRMESRSDSDSNAEG